MNKLQQRQRSCLSKAPVRTQEAAHWRARDATAKRGVKHYAYKCTFCDGWHITKKRPHRS